MEKIATTPSLLALGSASLAAVTLISSRKEAKTTKRRFNSLEENMKKVIKVLERNSLSDQDAEKVLKSMRKQQQQINNLKSELEELKLALALVYKKMNIKDPEKKIRREIIASSSSEEEEEEEEDEMLRKVKMMEM